MYGRTCPRRCSEEQMSKKKKMPLCKAESYNAVPEDNVRRTTGQASKVCRKMKTVILSEVRRQPNEVEGPRVCLRRYWPKQIFYHRRFAFLGALRG